VIKSKNIKKGFSISRSVQSAKEYGNEQEQKIAKEIDAKRTPNSGATPFMKGDMFKGNIMFDVKSTKHNQFILTIDVLEKLEDDAFKNRKIPILLLNFTNVKKTMSKRWVVMPYDKFFP